MENLSIKQIADELNRIAETRLPARDSMQKNFAAWCELHGWDCAEEKSRLLVARQAALLALIRQSFSTRDWLPTPLDNLARDFVVTGIDALAPSQFNFWGKLYNALIPQPERRRIGQFWTNELIADWMVAWLLQFNPQHIADVGCGSGNFLCRAVRTTIALSGCDVSPLMLNIARANLLSQHLPLPALVEQDYLAASLPATIDAIVCNPPYTRHHHIAPALKDKLQWFFKAQFHLTVSRQATLATYFLLKLIAEMPVGARAAIILPMQVLDARYGNTTKQILSRETRIDALIHFAPEMNAFANVDVGASILLFRKGSDAQHQIKHLTLRALPTTEQLLNLLNAPKPAQPDFGTLVIQPQSELVQVSKWFAVSAPTQTNHWEHTGLVVPLKELATVMRGIATGANEFFALTTSDLQKHSLTAFVVPTIQRNREIQDIVLDDAHWRKLSDEGKRVWLLYLNGEDISKIAPLRRYIADGETRGFNRGSLVNKRKRWYSMEQRRVPEIFFTILTRGNPRFILNQAAVRPLNMFSLVYPNRQIVENDCIEILWALLNSEFSLSKLHSVSRTYGGKTLKVEPRELDNLPVVNPLALPGDVKRQLKEIIADFETQRKPDVFAQKMNRIVEKILASNIPAEYRPAQPKQLQLLESSQNYKAKSRRK